MFHVGIDSSVDSSVEEVQHAALMVLVQMVDVQLRSTLAAQLGARLYIFDLLQRS